MDVQGQNNVENGNNDRANNQNNGIAPINNLNNAQGNGAQGIPPALRNWEAFCLALYGHRPSLSEFHGRSHEVQYLRRCEEYITAYQIPDGQRTKVIEKGLRNDAEKWWQSYKVLNFEWQRFRELLNDRFDSSTVRSELTTSLYSKKQGEKETVGAVHSGKVSPFSTSITKCLI